MRNMAQYYNFGKLPVYVFLLLAGILITGCKIDTGVDKIANILDESVRRLESQSVAWQSVLQDTSTQLVQAGQSSLANEVSNYPKVIVYFLPNSAKIANTCSFISL
jgi:hypothetical protein